MPHAHVTAASAARGRLAVVFAIGLVVLLVQVAGALASNSLALLADAGHLLTDVAGVGLALLAIWFAGRPPTLGRTFGYLRLEILAAVERKVMAAIQQRSETLELDGQEAASLRNVLLQRAYDQRRTSEGNDYSDLAERINNALDAETELEQTLEAERE